MEEDPRRIRHAGEIIYRNGGEVRVRRDDGQVFGGVCNDEDLRVGERVTFRLLDGIIAAELKAERA